MARSLNKVTLIGNVGGDPDVRSTPSGARVAKVSLATSRSFDDRSGQRQERTEWHRLTFWGKLADVVEQYVGKGDRLYVEGRIEYSQTEDDRGNTRYWTDIQVREMIMLGSRGERDGGDGYRGQAGGSGSEWQQESARHGAAQAYPASAGPASGDGPASEDGGDAEPEDDLPF